MGRSKLGIGLFWNGQMKVEYRAILKRVDQSWVVNYFLFYLINIEIGDTIIINGQSHWTGSWMRETAVKTPPTNFKLRAISSHFRFIITSFFVLFCFANRRGIVINLMILVFVARSWKNATGLNSPLGWKNKGLMGWHINYNPLGWQNNYSLMGWHINYCLLEWHIHIL